MASCSTYHVIILLRVLQQLHLLLLYFLLQYIPKFYSSLYGNYFTIDNIILKIRQNVYKVDLFKKALTLPVVGNTKNTVYIFYMYKIFRVKYFQLCICKFKGTLNADIENMASCFLSYFYVSYHAVRKFAILVRICFYFI